MTKIKKLIIIALSLIISIQSGVLNIVCAQNKDKKTVSNSKIDKKDLFNNKNWLLLVKTWKSLNDKDYNKGANISYNALNQTGENTARIIENLQKDNLLTAEQITFLKNLIGERIHYLQYHLGFIECYKMTALGGEIINKREDLEQRYKILQKLYSENKINTDTFAKTKAQISEDMNFIEKNSGKNQPSQDCLELLMYLNK